MNSAAQISGNHVRLTLCMIVRNEERLLPSCLQSVKGVVDEIVIVDTGSEDRTQKIAADAGARVGHYSWNGDFASARNAALALCTGEWILQLDADEELRREDGERIGEVIASSRAEGLVVSLVSQTRNGSALVPAVSRAVRLFRNVPGVEYRGMIHESVAESIRDLGGRIDATELLILHRGYECSEEELREKKLRNLDILLAQQRNQPRDLHTLLKLAETFVSLSRVEEADAAVRQAFAVAPEEPLPPADRPRLGHLYIVDAQVAMANGDWERAERSLRRSLGIVPRQKQAHWLLSKVKEATGNFKEAGDQVQRLADPPARARKGEVSLEVDVEYPSVEVYYRLGVLARKSGEDGLAEKHFRSALSASRAHLPVILSLASLLIDRSDFGGALELMERALALSPGEQRLVAFRDRISSFVSSATTKAQPGRVA